MSDDGDIKKTVEQIRDIFKRSGLQGKQLKTALREVVREAWPDMPVWTTLEAPVIEEVQKASLGSGVALVFEEGGVRKAVLARAGSHYPVTQESFMIPGGFINLMRTTGSTLVPASPAPEDAAVGAAREVEEELKNVDGSPLLVTDPARLKPMDTKTLATRTGERSIVVGFMLELTPAEVAVVKQHMHQIETDAAYAAAAELQSVNHDSGKPEVSGLAIVSLRDVASGNCNLLHKDQQSLFQAVEAHFARWTARKPPQGPAV